MEVFQALKNVPSSKALVKYFNGFRWSQCDCDRLRSDVETVSNLLQQLSGGEKKCMGFYCEPFLGLPALIIGAAASSWPFIFLDSEKMESNAYSTLFDKLQVNWIVSDRFINDASTELKQRVVICGTELFVYSNVGLPSVTTSVDNSYLYGVTTSGSTGIPKIVRVPSQSIFPNVRDFRHRLGVDSNDVILMSSALTFDPSMVEFFLAVLTGASLVMVSGDVRRNTKLLFQAIREGNVTFYQTTPSLFRVWSMENKRELLGPRSQLKYLVLGGEPFPSESEVIQWEPSGKVQIYNTYGITEVSCWATLKLVWPCTNRQNFVDGTVDIGEPLSETLLRTEIDDSSGLHHIFIGSSSRICALQDETLDGLLQDQTQPVFRATGDLFKIIDGKYFFCHRIDSTVKRLGKKFNMVLVEGKAKALNLNCAVVKSGSSDHTVVMFVVDPRNSSELHGKLESLKASLPSDHWPDRVEIVESLPLTPHGKLDKAALLDAHSRSTSGSLNEKTFEELWSCFSLGPVTKFSDPNFKKRGFMTSGGNSLNAVLFTNSLSERGFNAHQELLVLLLKGASFNDCLAFFLGIIKGESVDNFRLEASERAQSTQSEQNFAVTTAAIRPQIDVLTVSMALKGRVWPRIPCSSKIWDQEEITLRPEWKINLKKCVDASPLVVMMNEEGLDCMIIIGSHSGIVVVLDSFGEVKAKTQLPDRVEASACMSGDASSFYIGCYDGKLYKVRMKEGKVLWEFATDGMVKCTAVVHENKVFFGSYDKHIYAVNETGTMVWRREVGPITVPVLIHRSSIIVGTLTGKVVILNAEDGHEFRSISVTPVFANLEMVRFDKVTRCLLICPVNGSLEWRNVDDAFSKVHAHSCPETVFAAPVRVNDTDLLITSGATLQYLQPPECLWSRTFAQRVVATPFVVNSRLVVVTVDGELSVLSLNSGERLCSYRFPGEVFSSPVVVRTKIFVGCRDDYFHCVSVS